MNQGTINFILQLMTGCLNNSQMIRLQNTLNESQNWPKIGRRRGHQPNFLKHSLP